LEIVLVVTAIVLLASGTGFYLYRRHQRMLAGMSLDQRELYDAEKEYNREVKKAERSLWTATKAYEARVMWAEAKLAGARKHGEKHLGSYRGVHGNEIKLWENRVRVPRTGTKEDWWSDVTKRFLREHYFRDGPVEARVESHGADELYLVVEGDNLVGFVQCKPDDAPKARELAVKINNASRSIDTVLRAREEAIARATADLQAARENRSGVEEATNRLEVAKASTQRLDSARKSVEAQEQRGEIDSGG